MTAAISSGSGPPKFGDHLLRAALTRLSPSGDTGRLSVLIFHRVLPEPDELFPNEVDRHRFNQICAWLAAWCNVLPLDEAAERFDRSALPARAVSITFDDGYADNYAVALPVLKAHRLSATFFVAPGFLDGGRMWNDTVVESIRLCPLAEMELGTMGLPGIESLNLGSIESRRDSIERILVAAKYLDPSSRQSVVDRIAQLAGVALPDDLMMTSGQVKALATSGMQIGAHTMSHPILGRLAEKDARREMALSKSHLEQLLGQSVKLFAYPNGKPGIDYLPRDVQLARQVGFHAAVSTAPGAARPGGDVFQLPRFTPWDRGRRAFGLRMLRNLTLCDASA